MGHYAYVGEDYVVKEVIVSTYPVIYNMYPEKINVVPGWFKTSYNTKRNVHYEEVYSANYEIVIQESSRQDKALRGNYAGIGYIYIPEEDIFVPPKPFDSWVLNADIAMWVAPFPVPTQEIPEDTSGLFITKNWYEPDQTYIAEIMNNEEYFYKWDKETENWIRVDIDSL